MKKIQLTLDPRLVITDAAYQQRSDQAIWGVAEHVWFAGVTAVQQAMIGDPDHGLPEHDLTRHAIYFNASWVMNVISDQLTFEQGDHFQIPIIESFLLDSSGCFLSMEMHHRYMLDHAGSTGPVLALPDDPDNLLSYGILELMETHDMLTITYLD